MTPPHAFFAAMVLGSLALPGGARAQSPSPGEYHEFVDKRGQRVTAKLVAVTPDKRQMHIVRQDGQSFATEIALLSLDDQQYVKDWMKVQAPTPAEAAAVAAVTTAESSAPAAPPAESVAVAKVESDYRLEVTIARTSGAERKHRDDIYTMEEKESLYRISVKNLSRETIAAARVEYAIVWDDAVTVYQDDGDGDWDYSSNASDERPEPVKKLGGGDLQDLRFNGETTVDTAVVGIDRVLYDGNELLQEDEMIGVKVRVLRPDGTLLEEADSGGAALAAMSWETIAALDDPRVID